MKPSCMVAYDPYGHNETLWVNLVPQYIDLYRLNTSGKEKK